MWGTWLHGLYGLYGPRCPLSPKRLMNLISLSLSYIISYINQCKKLGKIFTGLMYKLLFSFTKNSDNAIFKVLYSKLYLPSPVLLSDSKVPRELWNGLSKAVPGKFHGPVGHSKRHCAKTEAIFTGLSHGKLSYFFSCDQAALWMVFSVRLSVCPSVRLSVCPSVRLSVCPSVTPFWLCSHHSIIMKFSGVITLDQGKVHAKGQGQRSKVKVTEVTTQIFVSGL